MTDDIDRETKDLIHSLRDTVSELSFKMQENSEVSDFIFPWLILATQNGMTLPPSTWDKIAKLMRTNGNTEIDRMNYLSALVAGLQMSCGRNEARYLDKIDHLIRDNFN